MRVDYINREQFIEANQNTLTLMDDRFMKLCLDGNIPCVQAMINHIIDKNLTVIETHAQKEYKSLHRSIAIDVYARDSDGKIYDIEIQNDSSEATARRARFHGSLMDSHHLDESTDFEKLPETYVIFITREDVLKHNKSMYTINRYIEGLNEPFNDGLHIVYVNCSAEDDGSKVWKLIHDMICPDPAKMFIQELADRVGFFKTTKKGREQMSDWFSDYEKIVAQRERKRVRQQERESIALSLLNLGKMTLEEIASCSKLALPEVTKLAARLKA
ncbi:MAG: PD-(D/E)XK nuclease family transposase [Synergistaceae bacterium]|nr:PD-(D/E)XK nuclease family transposase [Synergistaceae bacterium]